MTDPTPRETLRAIMTPAMPKGWVLDLSERSIDETPAPVVRASMRTLRQHPKFGRGVYEVDFVTTLTVAGNPASAGTEDRLDDCLLELVKALDDNSIDWSGEWNKANYDGRLGYQGTIILSAERNLD